MAVCNSNRRKNSQGNVQGMTCINSILFVFILLGTIVDANSVDILTNTANLRAKRHNQLTSFLQTEAQVEVNPRAEELLPWDRIRLTAASCQEGPTYSRSEPPNMPQITVQEQCGVCSRIVTNAHRWNWKKHYSSLCVGVPRHLLGLCKHWACKMSIHCPEFIGNKCIVDGYERTPCPKKYLCWNCLGLPKKAVQGCFDSPRKPRFGK